jgi:hypothetical protein
VAPPGHWTSLSKEGSFSLFTNKTGYVDTIDKVFIKVGHQIENYTNLTRYWKRKRIKNVRGRTIKKTWTTARVRQGNVINYPVGEKCDAARKILNDRNPEK